MRKVILALVTTAVTVFLVSCGGSSAPTNPTPTPTSTPSLTQVSLVVKNILTDAGVADALIVSDTLKDNAGKLKEFRTNSAGLATLEVPTSASELDIVITATGYHGPYETRVKPTQTVFSILPLLGTNNPDRVAEMIFGNGLDILNPGIVSSSKPAGNISIVYSLSQNVPEQDLEVLRESMVWMGGASGGRYTGKVETLASNPVVFDLVTVPNQATPGKVLLKYNMGHLTGGTLMIRGEGLLSKGTARHEVLHMLGLFHHRDNGLLGEDGAVEMSLSEQHNLKYNFAMPVRTRHIRNDRATVATASFVGSREFVIECKHK